MPLKVMIVWLIIGWSHKSYNKWNIFIDELNQNYIHCSQIDKNNGLSFDVINNRSPS